MIKDITYTIEKEHDDIQIRNYRKNVVAEITVIGSRRDASKAAFTTLSRYIRGENTVEQRIPMTGPISQVSSRKITMTDPVFQEQPLPLDEWSIAFFMPEDMNQEDIPKPKNSSIYIRTIPERRVAAITFSDAMLDKNVYRHERELRTYLKNYNIAFEDKSTYIYYNSPRMPWFLYHNEILFTLR